MEKSLVPSAVSPSETPPFTKEELESPKFFDKCLVGFKFQMATITYFFKKQIHKAFLTDILCYIAFNSVYVALFGGGASLASTAYKIGWVGYMIMGIMYGVGSFFCSMAISFSINVFFRNMFLVERVEKMIQGEEEEFKCCEKIPGKCCDENKKQWYCAIFKGDCYVMLILFPVIVILTILCIFFVGYFLAPWVTIIASSGTGTTIFFVSKGMTFQSYKAGLKYVFSKENFGYFFGMSFLLSLVIGIPFIGWAVGIFETQLFIVSAIRFYHFKKMVMEKGAAGEVAKVKVEGTTELEEEGQGGDVKNDGSASPPADAESEQAQDGDEKQQLLNEEEKKKEVEEEEEEEEEEGEGEAEE